MIPDLVDHCGLDVAFDFVNLGTAGHPAARSGRRVELPAPRHDKVMRGEQPEGLISEGPREDQKLCFGGHCRWEPPFRQRPDHLLDLFRCDPLLVETTALDPAFGHATRNYNPIRVVRAGASALGQILAERLFFMPSQVPKMFFLWAAFPECLAEVPPAIFTNSFITLTR